MKNLFSRSRREHPATQEPVLESRRLQEREENERFLRQLYASQEAQGAAALASPEPPGAEPSHPARTTAAGVDPATAAATAPPVVPVPLAASGGAGSEAGREGVRAALELLEVARQLLEGREDVESRVARQLVARALELLPPADGRRD